MMAEQVHGGKGLRTLHAEQAAGFAGEIERRLFEPRPQVALRGLGALRRDAVDIAIGGVELAHDAVVVHRFRIARQHRVDLAEIGLLALQLVHQAVGDGLFPHQAGRVLLNGSNVANPHHGGRYQEQNDQAEAGRSGPGRCSDE